MALAETDCTRLSMGRSIQGGPNTKLSRKRTPQNLKSSQNQNWMSTHQNQKEKAEEKYPERSRSQNATTTNNNTKPRSFSGLPKPPKAKYSRKACHHECRQSLFTLVFMLNTSIQPLPPFSL